MVEQIDVAPAEVTSLFIKLERADAQKVVDMLKEIFEKGDHNDRNRAECRPRPRGRFRQARSRRMRMKAARSSPRTR